jgi:3-hydroxymyristoyl/3-hydroxydecanoyl-(acyl carrier protein) dehydratase
MHAGGEKSSAPMDGDARMTTRARVAATSPWFRGHFPGDPILPGIAQLDLVCDLLSRHLGQPARLAALTRIKFKKIVRPGETLDIEARAGNKENVFTFRISRDGEEVCLGTITLAPLSTTSDTQ